MCGLMANAFFGDIKLVSVLIDFSFVTIIIITFFIQMQLANYGGDIISFEHIIYIKCNIYVYNVQIFILHSFIL